MDLSQLANLGEFVGGITVLVTLIYLAVQLRSGNELARDNASHRWTEFSFELSGRIVTDRELAEIWVRGGSDFHDLDAVDQQRLVLYEWRAIDAWHHAFLQHERGILPDPQWNKVVAILNGLIGERQSVQEAWKTFGSYYDKGFQELMETVLYGGGARAVRPRS